MPIHSLTDLMFVFSVNCSQQVALDVQDLVLRPVVVRIPVAEQSRWHRIEAALNGDVTLCATATREILRLRNTQTRRHIINISTYIADTV